MSEQVGTGRPVTGDAEPQAVEPAPPAEPREPQPRERPAKPSWWSFPRTRRYLTRFSLAGLTGALLFYCLSLTPSLLPRAWYLQAVMSGITVAIGYAVGTFAGWLLRSLIPWRSWHSISRTGCGEPTHRTCRRRCTGIRS